MSNELNQVEYEIAGNIMNILQQDYHEWVDDYIREKFEIYSSNMKLNLLEQINLLMFEIKHHYAEADQYFYDVCISSLYNCNTMRSRVHLLELLNYYSKNSCDVFDNFFYFIENGAQSSTDYRLLADFLISNKTRHTTFDDGSAILEKSKLLLQKAEDLACDSYEFICLARSYTDLDDNTKSKYLANIAFDLLRKKDDQIYTYGLLGNLMDEFELLNRKGPFPMIWGNTLGDILLEQERAS